MPTVKSHSGSRGGGKGHPAGKPKHVRIEFAPNGAGAVVHHQREGADGAMSSHGPMPFTKRAPMMKHVAALASEAMPGPTEQADEMASNTAGGEAGAGAPVAQLGS